MISSILPLPAPPSDGNLGELPASQVQNSDPQPEKSKPDAPTQTPVATHTRTIGMIHPPPDIRQIVEKTAIFVAKNGPDFERRIMASNAGNAKFNFLNPSDPYHAFYQHRVSEHKAKDLESMDTNDNNQQKKDDEGKTAAEKADASEQEKFRVQPKKILHPPEPEKYTVRLPEGITAEEVDIIKLTAQFVARNGPDFLSKLNTREGNNPQFHFLRPTHSMFTFFTGLADAYSEVLKPEKGLTEKLKKGVEDMTVVLERCLHRLEWDRSQEQERLKAEDEIENERLQMAMIDWHDFVVVETIEFMDDEDEELPIPMTLEEVIRRSKISALEDETIKEDLSKTTKDADMEMDDEEMQMVEEGMRAARIEENGNAEDKKSDVKVVATDEPEQPMRIVKNWKRPEDRLPAERDPTKFVISPITGELIPINEMAEHMRISLIDPKYKEQKERMMAKIRETTLAADDEISRNIVGLARTRPDIFGTTEEEVSNAVKAEIEKKKDEQPKQVIWDGHTGSIGRTANQALSQNTSEDVDNNMNTTGPTPPPPRPGMPSVRPLPPPPGLALNMPRYTPGAAPPRPGMSAPPMVPSMRPPPMAPGQQPMMMHRMPISVNPPNVPVPPPPGSSQFTPLGGPPRSYMPMGMPPPPMPNMGMMIPPPPMPQGMPPPPPPPEEAPPLPDEPEPKRQKTDDSSLIPEDQFLAQHPGAARISVSVPNVDEGNLKGQTLDITIHSLSETIGSLKEKIAGEVQLPANKQKLSGRAGFLKDNLSLAYYNISPGETLALSLRERGGRKR